LGRKESGFAPDAEGRVPPCGTHASLLRADWALHALLGMKRFPSDDTIGNLFKRFTQGMVVRFYEPLWAWVAAATGGKVGGARFSPRRGRPLDGQWDRPRA